MKAVFVDVGGTLWPNTWPLAQTIRDRRAAAVGEALGDDRIDAATVLAEIVAEVAEGVGVGGWARRVSS